MPKRRRGSSKQGELLPVLLLSLLCSLPAAFALAQSSTHSNVPAASDRADKAVGRALDRAAVAAGTGAADRYFPVHVFPLHRSPFHPSHPSSVQIRPEPAAAAAATTVSAAAASHVHLSSSVNPPSRGNVGSTIGGVRSSSRLPPLLPLPAVERSTAQGSGAAAAAAGVARAAAVSEGVGAAQLPREGELKDAAQGSAVAATASYNSAFMPSIGASGSSSSSSSSSSFLHRQQQLLRQQQWRQWLAQVQQQQKQVQQQQQQQFRDALMPSVTSSQPQALGTPAQQAGSLIHGGGPTATHSVQQHQRMQPQLQHQEMQPVSQHQAKQPQLQHQAQPPLSQHQEMQPVPQHQTLQPQAGYQPKQPPSGHQSMQKRLPASQPNQPSALTPPHLQETANQPMKRRDGPQSYVPQVQRMTPRLVDCPYRPAGQGQNLYRCAMGFAGWAGVTGGAGKVVYWVSTPMDHPTNPIPGSLRWGLEKQRGGAIIRFNRNMVINLAARIFVRSDSTIDGRGAHVQINGPMAVYKSRNVIIHNIAVGNAKGNTDALHIRNSSRVWVDHCRVTNAYRGTIDVVKNSTDVTISNCFIRNSGFTMLLGAADNDTFDRQMRVTVYRNWFDGSGQRQPHGRWGNIHVANNLYTNWTYYCIGGRVYANIRSDRNVFVAGPKRKEVTPWFGPQSPRVPGFDNTPTIRSFYDLLLNGATFHIFPGTPYRKSFVPPYKLPIHVADDTLRTFVARNAGPHVGLVLPHLPCTPTTCWSCC